MLPNFTQIRELIAAAPKLTAQDKQILSERLVTLRKVELLRVQKSLEMGSTFALQDIFNHFAKQDLEQKLGTHHPTLSELKDHIHHEGVVELSQPEPVPVPIVEVPPDGIHLVSHHGIEQLLDQGQIIMPAIPQEPSVQPEPVFEKRVPADEIIKAELIAFEPEQEVIKLQPVDEFIPELIPIETPAESINPEPEQPKLTQIEEDEVELIDAQNVAWISSLSDIAFTGEPVTPLDSVESHPESIPALINVQDLEDARQILLLEPRHVSFGIQENPERNIYRFVQNLTKLIAKNHSITLKRSLLMSYLKSPLFYAYISTGIVGINVKYHHNKVALNKISEENNKYLNAKQFKYAAIITSEIRGLCAF